MNDLKSALSNLTPSATTQVFGTAPRPAPAIPAHITEFLMRLQTKFAQGAEMDELDFKFYTKQVARLDEPQVEKVFGYLFERHNWRPSVSEVRAAVVAVAGEALTGEERAARRTIQEMRAEWDRDAARDRLAIAPSEAGVAAPGWGREYLRNTMSNLRGNEGSNTKRRAVFSDEEKQAAQNALEQIKERMAAKV